MKQYAIATLGCKVNQCESSALGHQLETAGYKHTPPGEKPDVVIINTCTVTGKAAMQSRQAIRQAIRNHPGARIVVTGCYAQTAPDDIKTIEGIDYIVGHADKLNITEIIQNTVPTNKKPSLVHQNIKQTRCFEPMPLVAPESRTRAFLKIQDGCNAVCSYCIVPHARGRSRSMPVDDVFMHLKSLSRCHFQEVVLTGIHLGAYGKDLQPKTSLYDLLRKIADGDIINRLRLSSIEPAELDSDIIALSSDPTGGLCPHFHIPLQSGDNATLKRMGRPYTREQFKKVIDKIRGKLPHAAIGADVLVGFPGENDRAYQQTYALIKELDITYLHVFPFSPRKGTPAAKFKDKIPDSEVKQRCKHLRELGEKKKSDFYNSNINRIVKVLIEGRDTQTGHPKGMSENYIPVIIPGVDLEENTIAQARIESIGPDLRAVAVMA